MITSDFSRLADSKHMLAWLSDDAEQAILTEMSDMLNQQVAGSALTRFVVTSDPVWLSGGKPSDDGSSMTLTRTAVAFELELDVKGPDATHTLVGVYTWAGSSLDQPGEHKQRIWFDIDGTLDEFGADGLLASRIYFAEDE